MKSFLMRIVGAVLINIFTDIALPPKWSKYTKIITGLIIISAIFTPLEKIFDIEFDDFFKAPDSLFTSADDYSVSLIKSELEARIEADIAERMKEEFDAEIAAEASVSLNEENKISGIKSIKLIGEVNQKILERIYEIYAPEEVSVDEF